MRAFTLATLVSASLVVGPAIASAESPTAKTFRDFITKNATDESRYIEAWWEANLDADPGLEHVALLCDVGGDDRKGYFIIEKDEAHRWEITFDVDSRTKACQTKPAAVPAFEHRTAGSVELRQGFRDGYQVWNYAIRVGLPVIVREEQLDNAAAGGKPAVKDWDLLIKKKKEKNYEQPEHMRQLNS
jgi:hypothetical protein